jgi:hypothetical protein
LVEYCADFGMAPDPDRISWSLQVFINLNNETVGGAFVENDQGVGVSLRGWWSFA